MGWLVGRRRFGARNSYLTFGELDFLNNFGKERKKNSLGDLLGR